MCLDKILYTMIYRYRMRRAVTGSFDRKNANAPKTFNTIAVHFKFFKDPFLVVPAWSWQRISKWVSAFGLRMV